ncbi:hypothetical protein BDV96DRAFT_275996 [Lophiotrema nucula]|uniref:Uncharacterized protein n=1 Tax=Lophiotrema nucula TaxID=690887 RepID=A0A6A5ZNM0_9PLEO|nr:hypothetical protein BDV96DRAFT_275996 [Lophiotrema nucula]
MTDSGAGHGRRPVCFNLRDTGQCRFGSRCRFSHDLNAKGPSNRSRHIPQSSQRPTETPEQEQARWDYNAWRRLIKFPPRANDDDHANHLWNDALAILNGDDRDRKQQLPRDLENEEEYYGIEHVKALLAKRSRSSGHAAFVNISKAFLQVMTHQALLDCLSVETSVGVLYNFFGGTNGTRAVPFLAHLGEVLVNLQLDFDQTVTQESKESTLIAMTTALRELLRRENRTRMNEDLPGLINSLENTTQVVAREQHSTTEHIVTNHISEIRAMIDRAKGLLAEEPEASHGMSLGFGLRSSYPHEFKLPRDRHDNDKADITKMKIFPTHEEILSDSAEFLPTTDRDQPHFLNDQAARHLDTHFRLYRHDTFGELKSALHAFLGALRQDKMALNNPKPYLGDMRASYYSKASISYVRFSNRRGLEIHVSFLPPVQLRNRSGPERRKWWDESRKLEEGTLLSFICIMGTAIQHIFLTVVERKVVEGASDTSKQRHSQPTVITQLAMQDQSIIETMLQLSTTKLHGTLLEYTNVLPPTFVPILENLQNMQRLGRLPFRQWILPDRGDADKTGRSALTIPPPVYARHPGFNFPLDCILLPDRKSIKVSAISSSDDSVLVEEIAQATGLDRGQSRALVAALTREFAFIQGPPGTGKTYLGLELMKVLLAVKIKANLGPIIVVCYTNHALDQFLELLCAHGVQKIIRMGGQSHSDMLEKHNLRVVSKDKGEKTKSEKFLLHKSYEALDQEEKQIGMQLSKVHVMQKKLVWQTFDRYLLRTYSDIHRQFRQVDDEGFQTAGRHPFEAWVNGPRQSASASHVDQSELTVEQYNALLQRARVNVQSLSAPERSQLLHFWSREIQSEAFDTIFEKLKGANATHGQIGKIHDEVDRRILQDADVIGVTTTGMAKRIATLQHVRCKVVICEEAGEVMEPHMLSALLPTVEHFIQIGDHQQLRPTINNFKDLSLESQRGVLYQLDRSQFERLSVGEPGRPSIPFAQLDVQRRMRPEISSLIRETIYPKLIDHPKTSERADVVGMRKNISWLHHDMFEDERRAEAHHQKSHSNAWEVDFMPALVRHIIRQGKYKSSDLALLTPYTGQLSKIRAALRNDFEIVLSERDQEALQRDGFAMADSASDDETETDQPSSTRAILEKRKLSDLLRVATVDNFQGEEAKIVIISLVRHNKEGKVGFLKTTNRINVLLSRAKEGMYLIGNTDTYARVPMWKKVIDMLRATDSVGTSLGLCCSRHPGTEIEVSKPDDFVRLSPEGGCNEHCTERLDCGHQCLARCHSKAMHEVFSCPQPCQYRHESCGHPCQKKTCGEDHGICQVKLDGIELPCGHTQDNVPCYLTRDLDTIRCSVIVQKDIPRCGHTLPVPCWTDPASSSFKCSTPCSVNLPCRHPCSSTCGECNRNDENGQMTTRHPRCTKTCGRKLATCNHNCPLDCHVGKACAPCFTPCEVRCKHSRCPLTCREACAPCVEPCAWACDHKGKCTLPCSAPCNRLPCDQRCTSVLRCGHQCPSLCGEDCPEDYCHTCSVKQDVRVDLMEFETYGEIDVADTPIVVLGCGHFFTAETLDRLMQMSEVYTQDKNGLFSGLKDVSASLAIEIPRCPDCQTPVRQHVTQRYNRSINRAVIDEMSKKFLVSGQARLQELGSEVDVVEKTLEGSRKEFTGMLARNTVAGRQTDRYNASINPKLHTRYGPSKALEKAIVEFKRKVADHHQPAAKLHQATVHAVKNSRSLDEAMAGLDIFTDNAAPFVEKDRRITLGARMIEIKKDTLVLEDKFSVVNALKSSSSTVSIIFPGGAPQQSTHSILQNCTKFINDCEEEKLPKLAVEAILYYARIVRLFEASGMTESRDRNTATHLREDAKALLGRAFELCTQPFQNADMLMVAVEEAMKLMRKEWYEDVTLEELASIKQAMVSGPRGIATHSGHWYNCVNGHPFAIGECGMPMEQARCPECGAPIGGQSHQAVAGVTRAIQMEH